MRRLFIRTSDVRLYRRTRSALDTLIKLDLADGYAFVGTLLPYEIWL